MSETVYLNKDSNIKSGSKDYETCPSDSVKVM
jgi:hypothetical protein